MHRAQAIEHATIAAAKAVGEINTARALVATVLERHRGRARDLDAAYARTGAGPGELGEAERGILDGLEEAHAQLLNAGAEAAAGVAQLGRLRGVG